MLGLGSSPCDRRRALLLACDHGAPPWLSRRAARLARDQDPDFVRVVFQVAVGACNLVAVDVLLSAQAAEVLRAPLPPTILPDDYPEVVAACRYSSPHAPLLAACMSSRPGNPSLDLARLNLLLAAGADPRACDARGRTSLHWVAFDGHADLVQRLVEAGAFVDDLDADGQTPLMHAVLYQNVGVLRELARQGADVDRLDSQGQPPLMVAVSLRRLDEMRALMEHGANVEKPCQTGQKALWAAVSHNAWEPARILLEAGSNPNQITSDGGSALVEWLRTAQWVEPDDPVGWCSLLLKHGASPKEAASAGEGGTRMVCPLSYLGNQKGNPEAWLRVAQLLLEAGGDPNCFNEHKELWLPEFVAKMLCSHGDCMPWLESCLEAGTRADTAGLVLERVACIPGAAAEAAIDRLLAHGASPAAQPGLFAAAIQSLDASRLDRLNQHGMKAGADAWSRVVRELAKRVAVCHIPDVDAVDRLVAAVAACGPPLPLETESLFQEAWQSLKRPLLSSGVSRARNSRWNLGRAASSPPKKNRGFARWEELTVLWAPLFDPAQRARVAADRLADSLTPGSVCRPSRARL